MKFPERSESGSKNLLKMKADESTIGIFRGEIHTFRQHWENQKPYLCTGAECHRCKNGGKSVFRFQLNFVTKENAVWVAKVFEQGWVVMEQLEELNKEYPLETTLVKITRKGNGTDTTYTILPSKGGQLTKPQEAEIAKVPLNVLDQASAAAGVKEASVATDGPDANEDEIAF